MVIWNTLYELVTLTMNNKRNNGFYESPLNNINNKNNLLLKYSKNLILFISKMLVKDYTKRWSANKLLKYKYLNKNKIKKKNFIWIG